MAEQCCDTFPDCIHEANLYEELAKAELAEQTEDLDHGDQDLPR